VISGVLAGIADGLLAETTGALRLVADFGPTLIGLGFIFAWLHHDEMQHAYRRSPLLNIGIVLVALVFVPVYLVRSRPAGRRFLAVMLFFAVVGLWLVIGQLTAQAARHLAG